MRQVKYVLAAVIAIGLMIVAFQAYSTNTITPSTSFAPGAAGSPSYPNPISQNITLSGVMKAVVVAPACSLSTPPCAIASSPLYYMNVNGRNYRLIFSNTTTVPLNRAHIIVTGIYVTPSTYPATLWTPQIHFSGDIYVIAYSYASPYT